MSNTYEDSAVEATQNGWACTACNRFYSLAVYGGRAQHQAQYCCAEDLPCGTKGCTNRRNGHDKRYTCCEPCRSRMDVEKWVAREKFPWPDDLSKNPVIYRDDKFFFDEGSFHDWLHDEEEPYEELRLEIGEFTKPPTFEVNEWLCDHLGMDHEADSSVDDEINKLIQKACPDMYYSTGRFIDPNTIPKP